eukprot:COSAG01_NODE_745_length_13872_cov_40.816525_6_plen_62_part_00
MTAAAHGVPPWEVTRRAVANRGRPRDYAAARGVNSRGIARLLGGGGLASTVTGAPALRSDT